MEIDTVSDGGGGGFGRRAASGGPAAASAVGDARESASGTVRGRGRAFGANGREKAARPHVLLAASGSVATIKLPEIAAALVAAGAEVRIVLTAAARRFVPPEQLPPRLPVYGDEDEWRAWQRVGDEVVHIELRRWADVLVIAPLSANTLAKIAQGLCDNLLTCVVRAWDFDKPLVVAPAMNTFMWDSPFTQRHLQLIRDLSIFVIPPVNKTLACGDVGNGAMAAPADVVRDSLAIVRAFSTA